MKKGFTLVELAIVLVVIGLLMGMAFKGKSLVDAARTKADIRKIEKMSTAINTYFAKYDTLPGKMAKTNPTDNDTYSNKSIADELIAEGSLNQADFKLASFSTYIHFTGCEEQMKGGGPVFFPVPVNINQRLCITLSPDPHSNVAIDIVNVTAVSQLYICYIETLLDDSNILTGSGRKTTYQHVDKDGNPLLATYNDCSKYADQVSTNAAAQGFAYLYQIY